MAYQGTDRNTRAKALGGVLAVHVALGALILTGLNVDTVGRAVERLKTFNINEEPPPPPAPDPPPPPPSPEPAAPDQPAPPNLKSAATPVVAPRPPISLPIPLPMNASERPAEGTDHTSGAAAVAGPGTGAGGQGSGFGGGGSGGSGDGRTPAQLISKIPNRDYRRIAGGRLPQGSAVITFRVEPNGRPADCRIVRSSGDPRVDAAICPIAVERLRFRPARDRDGRPIAQQITYVPTWRVR